MVGTSRDYGYHEISQNEVQTQQRLAAKHLVLPPLNRFYCIIDVDTASYANFWCKSRGKMRPKSESAPKIIDYPCPIEGYYECLGLTLG